MSGAPAAAPSLRGMWRIWAVYGASSILSRSIAFLLLPIFTRVLSPAEYGIRAMVGLGVEFILLLVACGMKEAINRSYVSRSAVSTGLLAHTGLIGFGILAGIVAAPWLAGPLLGDPDLAFFLRLGLLAGFCAHVQEAALVYLRAQRRITTVVVVSLGGLIAMVALNLYFVVVLRQGVAGIFYAEMIVYGLTGLVLTFRALREVGMRFVLATAREMASFGAPLMFMPLAWIFVTRTDGMFLTHYGSLAVVGIYTLAVQCGQVLQLAVIFPFKHYWAPTQFDLARDADSGRTFQRMFQWCTFIVVVAGFGCAVAAEEVIRVMTAPAFHAAAIVVPILVMAYVLEGVHLFFNSAILVRNRTGLVAIIALFTGAVNIAGNALLVPHFLATGAAVARVIAMLAMLVTTYVLAQRLWPQRVDFVALAKVSAWAVALFFVSAALPEMPLPLTVAVKAALVVALVALAIWSGAVDRRDAAQIWAIARTRVFRRRPRAAASEVAIQEVRS